MIRHVFFLRHFQTENNLHNRLNGRSLSIPISEGKPLNCSTPIDAILCSSALRCCQTIDYFLSQNNTSQVIFTEELLERNLGRMEGQLRDKMIQQYPNLFKNGKFILYSTPPDGETYDEFQHRALEFWQKCNLTFDGNILVCSHNQMLKMLYFIIKAEAINADSWEKKSFPYGKIVKIK